MPNPNHNPYSWIEMTVFFGFIVFCLLYAKGCYTTKLNKDLKEKQIQLEQSKIELEKMKIIYLDTTQTIIIK